MTHVFDISKSDDKVTVDANGNAKAIFTVTNVLPKTVRGTLRARATDAAQDGWLSIAGSTERSFPSKIGDQAEVLVKMPPGTPAGKYGVRLEAFTVDSPEEDLTKGPTVAVEVPAPVVVIKKASGIQWWVWVVIALVIVVVVGLLAWVAMRKKPDTSVTPTPVPPSAPQPAPQVPPPPHLLPVTTEFNDPRVAVGTEMLALDICREWGNDCGKPAADAWCASKNAGVAAKFNTAQNSPPTAVLGSHQICRDATCDRITWVQCTRQLPPTIRFRTQLLNGKSVELPE